MVLDGLSTAPAAAHGTMYRTVSDALPRYRDTVGRANAVGALAIAVPGALAGWCRALRDFGALSVEDVTAPAVRLAERGFAATPYLADCVSDRAADLRRDPGLAALFLPGGAPLRAGARVVQPEYAETLRTIARDGGGRALLGRAWAMPWSRPWRAPAGSSAGRTSTDTRWSSASRSAAATAASRSSAPRHRPRPGCTSSRCSTSSRASTWARWASAPPTRCHLLAEAMKIAFADRAVATADPAFVEVPVERLTDRTYAAERRRRIDPARTRRWEPGVRGATPAPVRTGGGTMRGAVQFRAPSQPPSGGPARAGGGTMRGGPGGESSSTTHVTVADSQGNVVASTQTINGLFGACLSVPGTGMIANNYMFNFDPRPGRALSVEPGKRVFTSMAPMMVRRGGRLRYALGLPGRAEDLPLRVAGAGEPAGPRHDAAGGGRGAPDLDRGRGGRDGGGVSRRGGGRAREPPGMTWCDCSGSAAG